MKIKSLLLGSAAAMVAVSGAQAADAIVIEPEPVEYVRVCDAYGAGWFYIPGTETCLRISGYVRVGYGVENYHDYDGEESDHVSHFRARLNVQANNETEYGTLSSYIRLQGDGGSFFSDNSEHYDQISSRNGPTDPSVVLDKAYISLAGFTVGYLDNWWSRGLRYGYYNISAFDFGWYNYDDALVLDYTYAANGWTFSVGLEDGRDSGTDGAPDAYAGVTYSAGGWFFGGVIYNDSSEGDMAYRVRADYDFGNGFRIGGWYAADDGETDYVKGHVYGLTAAMDLTDSITLFGGYFDYNDQFTCCGPASNSYTSWTVGLDWNITNGLLMQIAHSSFEYENESYAGPNYGLTSIELKRSF